MQLPIPYRGGWAMWPSKFENWADLCNEIGLTRPGRSPVPSGYTAIGGLASGRFLLLKSGAHGAPTEYVVGYFLGDARWHVLTSFPTRRGGLWYRREWARLSSDALLKAVWIHHTRPAVPAVWVAREARAWEALKDEEQMQVWRLLSAGAPGRVLEVIEAARACGLF